MQLDISSCTYPTIKPRLPNFLSATTELSLSGLLGLAVRLVVGDELVIDKRTGTVGDQIISH